jgi:hypothetical protein
MEHSAVTFDNKTAESAKMGVSLMVFYSYLVLQNNRIAIFNSYMCTQPVAVRLQ